MRSLRRRWTLGPAAVLFGGACATSHTMAPQPAGGWCPARADASPQRFSPPEVDRSEGPDLTWYAHDSSTDRERNADWCEAVGPSVVISEPHPALETGLPSAVDVVTWNALAGGGDMKAFMEAELGLSCAGGTPLPGAGFRPFVLLLQEVHRSSGLVPEVPADAPAQWRVGPYPRPPGSPDLVDVARACGLAVAYVPSSRNGAASEAGRGEDFGAAILSSLPFEDVVAVEVPFEGVRKVAVGAELRVPGVQAPLAALSVHLNVSAGLFRIFKTGNRTRERQVQGLLEALERHGWSRAASVAGGDFNTWSSREGALRAMARAYPDSPPLTPVRTRGAFPADHLFFRADPAGVFALEPDSYRVIEASYGSDHRPRRFRLSVVAQAAR